MDKLSPAFLQVLRSTLQRLEEAPGVDPDDPKLLEFKASIMRAIAEMEMRKTDSAGQDEDAA